MRGKQRWVSLWGGSVLGVWLGWVRHCVKVEKPLPPESPGKGTLRQEETVKRSSFLYEGQGTERRQRSSLPQVPDMEKQAAAVP